MDNETKLPFEENLTPESLRDPETLAKFIVSVLDSKKARDIRLLHVEDRTIIADYFVIATGSSRTQIRSFADEVEFKLSGYGIAPHHIEGADTGIWLLEDFGSVVVLIFSGEGRKFYNLDKLYEDTTEHDISSLITED
jgi:ribosome-associated protein